MSERIQELYIQAIEYADSVVPAERRYNDIYYAIAAGKHAQLIVKECAEIADHDHGMSGQELLEHFGVEE